MNPTFQTIRNTFSRTLEKGLDDPRLAMPQRGVDHQFEFLCNRQVHIELMAYDAAVAMAQRVTGLHSIEGLRSVLRRAGVKYTPRTVYHDDGLTAITRPSAELVPIEDSHQV